LPRAEGRRRVRGAGGEHLADLAAERRHQRQLSHFDDGDVDAAVSGTGGDLEADPPTTDDGQ